MQLLSLDTLLGIGSIIFALAYAYERFRKGGAQADADLISTLTEQLKAQKEINDSLSAQMKEMQAQIADLKQDLGKLQGINQANDQKIKEYLSIIANRNPELEATLEQLEVLIRQVMPFMEEMRANHQIIRQALHVKEAKRKLKATP